MASESSLGELKRWQESENGESRTGESRTGLGELKCWQVLTENGESLGELKRWQTENGEVS